MRSTLHLDDAPEDQTRVHREPHGLLQCGRGEIQIEEAVRLTAMTVGMPIAGVVEVKAAELEPRPAVIGSRREIAAEEVDRHVALALALEGRRARSDVGVDGALRRRPGGHECQERRRDDAAQPRHRCRREEAGLPGARVHSRLKMVCPATLG